MTRLNAHFAHGSDWGATDPRRTEKSYESVYPADASDGVNIDLADLGYSAAGGGDDEYSPLWKHALGDHDVPMKYKIEHDKACDFDAVTSADYEAVVTLTRNREEKAVDVKVKVRDSKDFENVVEDAPSKNIHSALNKYVRRSPFKSNIFSGPDSESVYINFENQDGDYLRLSLNPKGVYNLLYHSEEKETELESRYSMYA